MDVVSLCPLQVAKLVWRPSSGGFALAVIAKATLDLRPIELRLAEQQDLPNEDDDFWDDDPQRSLHAASDLVPFKPRADVVLVGHAFAPGKVPVRSLLARLSVSGVDKTLEVSGDPPFSSMSLRYERAANLQIPGVRRDPSQPVGFGPIGPRWPSRLARLGRHAASFPPRSWQDLPVPEDLDASYFNSAPPDQQTERIEPGDRLLLENLSPLHPRLVAELPRTRPRAFLDRGGGSGLEEVSLICDTLWIDTDRDVCTLTWRGQLGMHGASDEGRVSLLLEHPGRPLGWAEIQAQCGRRSPLQPPPRREPSYTDGALPFVSSAGAEPPAAPRAAASTVPPWLEVNQAPPPPSEIGGETVLPGALRVPARWPHEETPLAVSHAPHAPPLAPLAALPLAPAPLAVAAPAKPVELPPAPLVPVASPAALRSSDMVDLLWFDPELPDRARLHLPWQELIAALRAPPPELHADDDPPEDPPAVKDRRDVFGVLTGAEAVSLEDLDQALAAATSPRGAFTPPLALVGGELELTFDDLKTLEATLAAVAPFTAGPDKKLKDAFDAGCAGRESPWIPSSARALENLATRVRDAFAQGSWSLPAGYLDQQVERALVERRQYQKRAVLGETWIRALLGGRGAGVPAYLPEALGGKLPLYARFPVKMIVEVHLQQDQYESHPCALRCLALARVTVAKQARVGKAR